MSGRSLVVVLALAASACAAEPPLASISSRVAGTHDVDGHYSGVVGLLSRKGDAVARCSGVLVAPDLLLTARHCVALDTTDLVECGESPLGEAVVPEEVQVTTLPTMSDELDDYVAATEIHFAPGGDDTCGFDLAAVRLAVPLGSAFYAPRFDAPVEVGEAFLAVGFGSALEDPTLGLRRYTYGRAACIGSECQRPEVQETEWLAEDDAFCRADSGAVALDADDRVLGVVSRGQNPCATPILAALPPWREWLTELASTVAESSGYGAPEWVGGDEAEPASDSDDAQPLQSSCAIGAPGTDSGRLVWLLALAVALRRTSRCSSSRAR